MLIAFAPFEIFLVLSSFRALLLLHKIYYADLFSLDKIQHDSCFGKEGCASHMHFYVKFPGQQWDSAHLSRLQKPLGCSTGLRVIKRADTLLPDTH